MIRDEGIFGTVTPIVSFVGYARVSAAEGRQVLDRQLNALNAAAASACTRIRPRAPWPIAPA